MATEATTIDCYQKVHHCYHADPLDAVLLDYASRTRSRGKSSSREGREIAWFFERGEFLRDGDCLVAADGGHIGVVAAPEPVSCVTTDDAHLLTRVAYHLGNRHVPLQVAKDYLLFQPDHVLDDMVRGLGAAVTLRELPFQPEDGAYHGTVHSHEHAHEHSHEHSHEH